MKTINVMIVLCAFALLVLAQNATVQAEHGCCPACGVKICTAIPETTKEKKTVYEVEQKDICVPSFNWPWQKCCPPKCGYVRTVCVLKKSSRECEACGYQWKVTTVDDCSTAPDGARTLDLLHRLRRNRNDNQFDSGCADSLPMTYSTNVASEKIPHAVMALETNRADTRDKSPENPESAVAARIPLRGSDYRTYQTIPKLAEEAESREASALPREASVLRASPLNR